MIKLRDYQEKVIENTLSAYERGVRSGIINLSTGMGKSLTATHLAKAFRKRHGGKCLFLVDQIELAYQAKKAFLQTDPSARVGIEMNIEESDSDDDIVISCVATIGRKGSKRIENFSKRNFKLIIADEVHKSLSPIWLRVLHFLGVHPENFDDGKLLVGLTATAYRTDGKSLGYLYDDIYGQYDIRYGIANGWLTDIEWVPVKSGTDISKIKVSGGEFSQLELAKKVDNPVRNAEIVKSYLEYSPDEPAIVFCAGVQHAYTMAELFKQAGVSAECIEGGTDREIRKDWIEAFRSGELKVLTNHSVLTVGFDAPETTTIIMARPIRSTLTYTQAIGRGLRPSATAMVDLFDDPDLRKDAIKYSDKPACKIIDFEDNVGSHNVCRPPMLFGLSPKAKTKKKARLYEEVVEPLEELKLTKQVDISKLLDLDSIELISERKKLSIQSYQIEDRIKEMSALTWLTVGEESYEMVLTKDNKAMLIERNMLDHYDLSEYDMKSGLLVKLQTFGSLQGAIKTADAYIKQKKYDVTFQKNDAAWRERGVSFKQASLLQKLFKGGCRFGPGRYPDTGQLHVTINGNFVANSGEAANILNDRLKK